MDTIRLPLEFKEFLKLLTERRVDYLLIGGFAVSYYGYPRTTGDMDLWIDRNSENATKIVDALIAFGFDRASLQAEMFLAEHKIVRFGVPPLRIEIHTTISGVAFADCFPRRHLGTLDGIEIPLIDFEALKVNKRASGRAKDLADLENLTDPQ